MQFVWTPASGSLSCTDCAEPLITATDDQVFVVKVTDADGCMDFDTVRVRVNKLRPIYFPNVFDPEQGTFPNNFFTGFSGPAATGMVLLRVFDRWGSLVYEVRDIPLNQPNLGWDGTINGKKADTGVYVWYAKVRFVDNVELDYDGDVTVIR
jgi:gliding motility-associated-like protein